MSKEYIFKSSTRAIVELDGDFLEIQRKGFFRRNFSLRNRKIDINNVSSVKFREADAFNYGYLYFVVKTDQVGVRGDSEGERDETTIWFGKKEQKLAEEIKNYVEYIISK